MRTHAIPARVLKPAVEDSRTFVAVVSWNNRPRRSRSWAPSTGTVFALLLGDRPW
jgi:hypothetical protein